MELSDIGPYPLDQLGGAVEIAGVAAFRVEAEIGERRRKYLLWRVEQADAATRELLRQRRLEQQSEAVARHIRPERALDHRRVEADPGHAPQIGDAMRVAGIRGRRQCH